MHRYITLFLLVALPSLLAYPVLPEPKSDEEALLIRRIVDFWRDKEYPFARSQIQSYLKEYPQNECADHFWAMLGDMALQTKAFPEAIAYYDKIKSEELKVHVQLKRWQALYQLGMYAQLYQETASLHLDSQEEESHFYQAESAFREALSLLQYPEGKEHAQALCEEALPHYQTLLGSALFATHSKLALAEIHRLLNHPEKSAALYLELASQEGNQEMLFQAATVLLQCNKERAASIFKKLAREGGPKASDAAYQWLTLLAEQEEWSTIAHERELFLSSLDQEHLPFGFFYLGMLSFEKKMYHQAVADLQKSLAKTLSPQLEQKALLTLLASARELEMWDLCETCFETLSQQFPQVIPEASLMLASAFQKAGQEMRALKIYDRLVQEFPESHFAERAAMEKIRVLAAQKNFGEAHAWLLSCLQAYPQAEKKIDFVRLAIDLSLTQLAEEGVYGQLAADLERGLEANIFSKEEKIEKEKLLAKAYLKLNRVNAALQLLQSHEKSDPLLLTHCYIEEGTSPENVIAYGEKALHQHPEEKGLHLHLFNAYVELSKENDDPHLARQAAAHLSAVMEIYPISLENQLWLAHYLVQEEPLQAIPLLESLVKTEANIKRFDGEAFLLATLYKQQGRFEEAEPLLAKIAALQQKTEWEAKLKLAEVLALNGKYAEAKALYQKLEESAQLAIAYAARLQLARLEFPRDPEKSLKKLHEVAARKALSSEPAHIEAALDYAEFKASTFPEEERLPHLIKLLSQVKEDFTKEEDVWSKDYHASRPFFPEKDLIYQAYMRYLDARLYCLQSRLCQDPVEGKTKLNAAKALFSTLRQGKYAVSDYIKERATLGFYEK